jgi:hypothetical protein
VQPVNDKINKMNEHELKLGAEVVDLWGHQGVVVKIVKPDVPTIEDHGTVFVWQSDRIEYGADNCEHYTFHNWQKVLRVVNENKGE